MNKASLRSIPQVEKVLQALGPQPVPRPLLAALVRRELAALRQGKSVPPLPQIIERISSTVDAFSRSRIQPVINGTGILVHTNLGRAPMGSDVVQTLQSIASSYNNLEFDLSSGQRGARAAYLEHNLALLCGAESATVVNNCAAALLLVLRHFAGQSERARLVPGHSSGQSERGRLVPGHSSPVRNEVIISRGELVQIGGGFRIPEILEASGAKLREVGTTNKTSLQDYVKAIRPTTALILKVHRSNFFMSGFVESPSTEDISALARKKRLPFVEDLGSGAVIKTEAFGPIEHEPTPAEILKQGVDLVTFSGDKLLGGPQAGIIAGKAKYITRLKREPFIRALRCDKLILAALQITVDLYLHGRESTAIPVLSMLGQSNQELQQRAGKMVAALADLSFKVSIGRGKAQIGGGTLPRSELESVTIDLVPQTIDLPQLASRLRAYNPPVIGHIAQGRFKLDLRTIFPEQDSIVIQAIRATLS